MTAIYCGVCQRIKTSKEWHFSKEKRDPSLKWESTYCRFCMMEMTFAKNKKLCEKLRIRLIDISLVLPMISDMATIHEGALFMKDQKRGVIGIKSKGILVGILTEKDFVQKVVAADLNIHETELSYIMSFPVHTIERDKSIPEAALEMSLKQIRHIVIENEDRKSWRIVSSKAISESMQTIITQIHKNLTATDDDKKKIY